MVNDKLTVFLNEAAAKNFKLGAWDCGLWLADWYMAATGRPDPAEAYRDLGSESPVHIRVVVRDLNLARVREPSRGDVGLISLRRRHLVGCIFPGARNALILCESGLGSFALDKARFVAAWRVE